MAGCVWPVCPCLFSSSLGSFSLLCVWPRMVILVGELVLGHLFFLRQALSLSLSSGFWWRYSGAGGWWGTTAARDTCLAPCLPHQGPQVAPPGRVSSRDGQAFLPWAGFSHFSTTASRVAFLPERTPDDKFSWWAGDLELLGDSAGVSSTTEHFSSNCD